MPRGEMAFAAARRAEQDQIGAFFEALVARTERYDLCFRYHWHGIEGKTVQTLARRQTCFGEMTFDAPSITFGNLVLGEASEEASCRPLLAVSVSGDVRPGLLDGGKPQIIQDQCQAFCIDLLSLLVHAASPHSKVS